MINTIRLLLMFLILCLAGEMSQAQAPAFDPISVYTRERMEGFTVLIHPTVLQHPDEATAMRKELGQQLREVIRVLPAHALLPLKKVQFWVEWNKREKGAAEFHPSAVWLREHGYNPEKAGGIEISNTRHFIQWSRSTQPFMILHELAHAYHHRVLGVDYASILAAYQQAMERKLYESVEFIHGGKRKAYAQTNAKEYFAELTEAYFGKNDFYPFTRTELQQHDTKGYELMKTAWEKGTIK